VLIFYHWKWPAHGTGTVPVVSAHFPYLRNCGQLALWLTLFIARTLYGLLMKAKCQHYFVCALLFPVAENFNAFSITWMHLLSSARTQGTHTHTRLTAPFPGLFGWAGTRKVKSISILPKQETVSGSDISRAICKSAPRSRQITTPAPHHSVFYRPDALPCAQPTVSKHWRPVYANVFAAGEGWSGLPSSVAGDAWAASSTAGRGCR